MGAGWAVAADSQSGGGLEKDPGIFLATNQDVLAVDGSGVAFGKNGIFIPLSALGVRSRSCGCVG